MEEDIAYDDKIRIYNMYVKKHTIARIACIMGMSSASVVRAIKSMENTRGGGNG